MLRNKSVGLALYIYNFSLNHPTNQTNKCIVIFINFALNSKGYYLLEYKPNIYNIG